MGFEKGPKASLMSQMYWGIVVVGGGGGGGVREGGQNIEPTV